MGDKSGIEWTDATWNPATGCDRVSPGCAHCYALDLAARLKGMGQPRYQRDGDPKTSGPGFGLTLHHDKLGEPLRWTKPRMVFVNSMSDLFHEEIPDAFLDRVFATMVRAERHTFQVLTKRPERAAAYFASEPVGRIADITLSNPEFWAGWPPPNVWLGVSIENARYTWRADVLREIPAAVRFISAEPLLGSLYHSPRGLLPKPEFTDPASPYKRLDLTGIDWLIVGGESGGRFARPMHPTWARELRDACTGGANFYLTRPRPHAAYVPYPVGDPARGPAFFFKQWGSWAEAADGVFVPDRDSRWVWPSGRSVQSPGPMVDEVGGTRMRYAGPTPKSGGRLLDGREWDEMPRAAEAVAV